MANYENYGGHSYFDTGILRGRFCNLRGYEVVHSACSQCKHWNFVAHRCMVKGTNNPAPPLDQVEVNLAPQPKPTTNEIALKLDEAIEKLTELRNLLTGGDTPF